MLLVWSITPGPDHLAHLQGPLQHRQQRRLAKLADERTKLLHVYYQSAIPMDLPHQEQDRIASQTAAAEGQLTLAERSATDVQTTLDKALDLLAGYQNAYAKAPGHLRRQWNHAFFLRLHVHDGNIQHADLAEPFATLTAPDFLKAIDAHSTRGSRISGRTVQVGLDKGDSGGLRPVRVPPTALIPGLRGAKTRHVPSHTKRRNADDRTEPPRPAQIVARAQAMTA